VPVSTQPAFKAGTPRFLFRPRGDSVWLTAAPNCDRFLQTVVTEEVEPAAVAIDLDWPAQLGR
jgi:hypothetical protein